MKKVLFVSAVVGLMAGCNGSDSTEKYQNSRNKEIDVHDSIHEIDTKDVLIGNYAHLYILDNYLFILDLGSMENMLHVFDIENSYSLEDVRNGNYKLLLVKDVLDIDKVVVSSDLKNKILNGNKIKGNYSDMVLFLDEDGGELAIYKKDNDDYKVEVML